MSDMKTVSKGKSSKRTSDEGTVLWPKDADGIAKVRYYIDTNIRKRCN